MAAPRFGSFLFGSLRGYRRGWLRADLVAGLAVWAVLVPESLATPCSPVYRLWWVCGRRLRRSCGTRR
jgi:hypothetical protein